MKNKVRDFNQELQECEIDMYSTASLSHKLMKLFKEIIESQAYQMLSSYKLKFKISNKLSRIFDEDESEHLDNIRAQYHMNVMKDEQEFKEKTLKMLAEDMMSTFAGFMEKYKTKIEETNCRITYESNLMNDKLMKIEQNLQNRVYLFENDTRIEFGNINKNYNELLSIFENSKITQNAINQNLGKDIEDNQNKIANKVDDLSKDIEKKLAHINSSIQDLSREIEELGKQNIEAYESLNRKLDEENISLKNELKQESLIINKDTSKIKARIDQIANDFTIKMLNINSEIDNSKKSILRLIIKETIHGIKFKSSKESINK